MDRVAVVGAGAWGTALACHLAAHGSEVTLWARRTELASELLTRRVNPLLPGVLLPSNLLVSDRLVDVLAGVSCVVLATPCDAARSVLGSAALGWPEAALLVTASKGIENVSRTTVTEVAEQVLGARLKGA